MYGGYSISLEALKILEQFRDDLPIEQGRFLFKNLSLLDSVNMVKQLSEVTNYDLTRDKDKWKTRLDTTFQNFDSENNLSGLIYAAKLLSDIYKTAPINASIFSGVTFISKPSEDLPQSGINVNFKWEKAYNTLDIFDLYSSSGIKKENIVDLFPGEQDSILDNYLNDFKNALSDNPLFNIYKLINPECFNNLGGIFIYKNDIRNCLNILKENSYSVSQELQVYLQEYLPAGLIFNPEVNFCVGFPSAKMEQINLEYYGNTYLNIKNNIARRLFLKSKEHYYTNVFNYLVTGKDTLFLKVMDEVYNGGILNYVVPVKYDNRPLTLLEKDFNHFRRITGEIRKGSSISFIDTLYGIGMGSTKLFHTMGTQMAASIEKAVGKTLLINSILSGSVYFFKHYKEAYTEDPVNIREVFRFPDYFEKKIDSLSSLMPEKIILDVDKIKMFVTGFENPDAEKTQNLLLEKTDSLYKAYSKNIDYKNNLPFVNMLFADLFLSQSMYKKAAESFLKSFPSLPNKSYSAKNFALSLYDRKAYEEALTFFNDFVKYSYNSTESLVLRANCFIKLNKIEEAIKDLEIVTDLEPWNDEIKILLESLK